MSTTYLVAGMSCGGCASAVTSAVKLQAPEAQVSVDLGKGAVTVEGATEEQVKAAVADAGFTYIGLAD